MVIHPTPRIDDHLPIWVNCPISKVELFNHPTDFKHTSLTTQPNYLTLNIGYLKIRGNLRYPQDAVWYCYHYDCLDFYVYFHDYYLSIMFAFKATASPPLS